MYYYLAWLEDDIVRDDRQKIDLKDRIIYEVGEAQVKYKRLQKRVFVSEAKNIEHHKVDMEAIGEWKEIANKSTEILEHLEQGLMELDGKMRKRLWDCQGMDPDEGGKFAMAYLILNICDLGNVIDVVKRAKQGEGPLRTN